jgi:hypothetical protein
MSKNAGDGVECSIPKIIQSQDITEKQNRSRRMKALVKDSSWLLFGAQCLDSQES